MSNEIIIPLDLWEEDTEAVITNWLVSDGANVSQGDIVAEIMVEKIQHDIEATGDGVISISKQADEIVKKGDVIATLG